VTVTGEKMNGAGHGLFIQLAGMGDLVMALPAIRSVQAALPGMRWTLLTRPDHGDLLDTLVDDVVTMRWPPTAASLGAVARTLTLLRRRRFDVAIHLYRIGSRLGALGIKGIFAAVRPQRSIGRIGAGGAPLFDMNWHEQAGMHEVDRNLALIEALGVSTADRVPSLKPDASMRARIGALLAARLPRGAPIVGIFPGGARATRRWPSANYAVLAALFAERGMAVCVFGDAHDREAAQRIAAAAGPMGCDLSGALSSRELAAALSLMTLYIGNDSGPTHVAAAVGTPCVALFGPGDADWIAPRGNGAIRLLRYPVSCSPCYRDTCPHHTCMLSLTLDQVAEAAWELLDRAGAGTGLPAGGRHAGR
jgi:ADP-heptose:LPS heptosyltransferase